MCNFFSFFSDGKGNLKIVTPEILVGVIAKGYKDDYGQEYVPNSHSSFAKILGINQDDYNSYEYSPETDTLTLDQQNCKNDKAEVHRKIKEWFADKDIISMRNLYGLNSGYWNSGDGNSGDWNSGNRNSGDWNSGNRNSGNRNSGNRNSGYGNSGDGNSGDWNSGYGNSGNGNSGENRAFFCSESHYFMFDKKATKEEVEKVRFWFNFPLCVWISEEDMTDQEKIDNPDFYTNNGYLKTNSYKEAWKLVKKEDIDRIRELPHFDAEVFKELTGLDV